MPPSAQSCALSNTSPRAASNSRSCSARSRARSSAGGRPVDRPPRHLGELRSAQLRERLSQQVDGEASTRERGGDPQPVIVQQPEHADHGGRPDRRLTRLVVEADVAAGHRGLQGEAGIAHTPDRFSELPHHLGPLRVAEVHAVGDGERLRAAHRHVPCRLGDRVHRAQIGVEGTEAALPVAGEGDPLHRARDANDGGVAARTSHRLALDP